MNKSFWKDKITDKSLFLKYNFFTTADVYKFVLAKVMFLTNIKALPEVFESYFSSLEHKHNYTTRSLTKIILWTICKQYWQKSLKFNGIQLWNKLASTIKSCSSYCFKKEYKEIMWESYRKNN